MKVYLDWQQWRGKARFSTSFDIIPALPPSFLESQAPTWHHSLAKVSSMTRHQHR